MLYVPVKSDSFSQASINSNKAKNRLMGLNITGNRMVFHICLVLMLIFLMMSQTAIAKNVGITIQYTGTEKDINPATYPLTKEITGKLDISENTNNVVAIGKALNELQDGDILVLAVHSNPEVFGIGKETDRNWAEFWKTFDVKNPPKLGVVVILGCMKGENDAPATPEQQEAIRKTFNADALFAPQKAINPLFPGLYQVNMIVDDVKNGKELSEINPGRMWNCVTAPGVNKNEYTWPPKPSLDACEKIMTDKNVRDPSAWLRYGNCLSGNQKFTDALVAYDNALPFDPQNTPARNAKEALLNQLGAQESLGCPEGQKACRGAGEPRCCPEKQACCGFGQCCPECCWSDGKTFGCRACSESGTWMR